MQRGDGADPFAGAQIQQRFSDAKVIVAIRQAALALDRKIEILDPIHPFGDVAALRQEMQGKLVGEHDVQLCRPGLDARVEFAGPCGAVMVASIHQQPHTQPRRLCSCSASRQAIG